MTINENGKERKVTRLEAAILSLAQQGMRGNVKATTAFLEFSERHLTGANDDTPEAMPEEDIEILRSYAEREAKLIRKRRGRRGDGHE